MTTDLFHPASQHVAELVGIFVFAVTGALLAIRRGFDAVGIAVLALVTALGGGVLRDLVLNQTPAAFADLGYLATPFVAAAVTFFLHPALSRLMTVFTWFDAAGMALFCVTGTIKALLAGLGPLSAALLGVVTAVGGGVMRDLIAAEVPRLVRAEETLYSVPAFGGALAVVGMAAAGWLRPWNALVVAGTVFALRMLAVRFAWRAPVAWGTRRPPA